ncbi:MAG: Gfo/Idh/MocA family oxidoreductase [Actinomycetota bacterium]
MSARAVRIGVLGTSWWADSMYLPALAAHPDVEVVGLCGRTRSTAEALAATWDVPWVSTDSDEFLDPDRLDAVVVATSNDSHEPITVAAIERGLHVLCEKPTATTLAGARRMAHKRARLAARAGSL